MTAKINTTDIKIKSLIPRVSKKLSVQRTPGHDGDAIEGLGSQGAELQIELQADTLAEKHSWTAEFLKTGPQVLEDPDGYIYNIVESQATGGRNYESEPNIDQRWLFGFQCLMGEPFKFSSNEISRLKTITTNGQEWSADDSANAIATTGTIDVIPDIEVVAGALGSDFIRGGLSETETTAGNTDVSPEGLRLTHTFSAVSGKAWKCTNINLTFQACSSYSTRLTVRAYAPSLNGGVELDIYTVLLTAGTSQAIDEDITVDTTAGNNEDLQIRYYSEILGATTCVNGYIQDVETTSQQQTQAVTKDLTIYNTADTTRKVQVCNEIPPGTTVKINKNGTGHYNYPEDFTTDTYKYVSYDYNNVTYNPTIDVVTLAAADGYIIYKIDTKYPITGIPTLSLFAVGVLQISIAEDINGAPGTYYEIDEQSSDNISSAVVTKPLDNLKNFRLKGETSFFLKIYTDGATQLVFTDLEFNCDIVTIDTLLPKIYLGGPNTFRADQNSDSSLNATVTLTYRDGHWVI